MKQTCLTNKAHVNKSILASWRFGVQLIALLAAANVNAQWKPAGDRIKTSWAEQINPQNVLPDYPRPIMERSEWKNLNGLWNFAITPVKQGEPAVYDRKILTPFAVESSLSGIQQAVDDTRLMWYNRTFSVPEKWKNRHVLLHFGAVDWKAEVFLNGIFIGSHTGGYTPFSFDITSFLLPAGEQVLTVKVWDPTDRYFQPRGKQVSNPDNIVYTAVSGIWQTVWIEPVAEKHIASLKILPDIDEETLFIKANTENTSPYDYVEVRLFDDGKLLSSSKSIVTETIGISIPEARLWSPETPFLYDLEVNLYSNGKLTDKVKSYCAMRKISTKRDSSGVVRLQLNNRTLFHFGLLDQGWFPDGLYTAPADEALAFDIIKAKSLGYNMLRKHIKVEPARWYTHCDRIGMLVWQDMPSGDNNWWPKPVNYHREYPDDAEKPYLEARENWKKEWKAIIDNLYSYPCIVMWIPFNEGWGQFDTKQIAEWTKSYDPSRILNPASGGNFYHTGDVLDMHNYPAPEMFLFDADRVNVLGEYGGIGYAVDGHLWKTGGNFGYEDLLKTSKETTDKYIEYLNILATFRKFSGAVYTQMSDVEGEVNGLVTYDRKVTKMDADRIRNANRSVIRQFSE